MKEWSKVIFVVMATLCAGAVNGQEASWKEQFDHAGELFSKWSVIGVMSVIGVIIGIIGVRHLII